MRLWNSSARPGYANLSPAQPLSAQPENGLSDQKRPRSSTLDRMRDKKVSLAPGNSEDHESLLGDAGLASPVRKHNKPFKPSLPTLPSKKRLSFSLDAIKPKNSKAETVSSETRRPAKSISQAAKASSSEAGKQAETVLCLISGQDAVAVGDESAQDVDSRQARPVSAKELNQLKSALVKPKEATRIIEELKKIPRTPERVASERQVVQTPPLAVTAPAKGACLDCSDAEAMDKAHATHDNGKHGETASPKDASSSNRFNRMAVPSAGKMLGQLADSAGAFEALAGMTGKMIDASGAHNGIVTPPMDRLSVLIYWWGYELVLPPPSIRYLASVHSVAGTAFTFLQALTVGGGVPELTPFIRYLSMYMDMEWKAIQTNDKGKGVVLAATWVLPVAVVPRPMAF